MGAGTSRGKWAARGVLALATALWLVGAARDAGDRWIAATVLPPLVPALSTEVLARDGSLLRAYTVADGRWRMAVTPDAVDPLFTAMLIGMEDRRFHDHAGVDPLALIRAAAQALRHGRIVSGGSTLTMQVARLLEDSGTGRASGKLRQMRLALALERRMDKDAILALYLQIAPYGGNIEGLRAASLAWFGKEPRRLTPAEAALLVALPQSPGTRRPDRFPDRAEAVRNRVLNRATQAGIIDAATAEAAKREPVPRARRPFPALAPHLADRVVAAAPEQRVHRLTLDPGLQRRIEQLAADALDGQGDRMQIAIVMADHTSGEILASVGSAAYQADRRQGFVDMTRALRSPGSTLKPLVYGLAFDEGLAHPETLIEDRPARFGTYAPQNFDRTFRGEVRVREALHQSLNLPVVALTDALGPAKLLGALDRAGVRAVVPGGVPGLAVALGGVGVSLEDMVQLYAAIARGGVVLPLYAETGAEAAPGQRLLSAVAAWQVGDILAGMPPPAGAPARALAYKTGTSYGHRDAWAIGFDGRHVAGVWMGRADGTPVPGVFGGDLAAPVLFQAFGRLKAKSDPLPPPPPATLTVATAALPPPLQRFRPRGAAFAPGPGVPSVAFPPDGAEVELLKGGLMVRVQGGTAPYTWLANGAPLLVGARGREAMLPFPGPGFVTLSVIDAEGRSARSAIRLR